MNKNDFLNVTNNISGVNSPIGSQLSGIAVTLFGAIGNAREAKAWRNYGIEKGYVGTGKGFNLPFEKPGLSNWSKASGVAAVLQVGINILAK